MVFYKCEVFNEHSLHENVPILLACRLLTCVRLSVCVFAIYFQFDIHVYLFLYKAMVGSLRSPFSIFISSTDAITDVIDCRHCVCVVCYLVVAPGDGEDVSSDGPADVPDDVNKLVEQLGCPGVPCRVLTRPDEHPSILPEIRHTFRLIRISTVPHSTHIILPAFNPYLTTRIPHPISEMVQLVKTYNMCY